MNTENKIHLIQFMSSSSMEILADHAGDMPEIMRQWIDRNLAEFTSYERSINGVITEIHKYKSNTSNARIENSLIYKIVMSSLQHNLIQYDETAEQLRAVGYTDDAISSVPYLGA